MRSKSILLSMLVLVAMVLAACGGGATSTNVVSSPPPVTVDATDDMATDMPTEAATMEGTATGEPGVPVTGDVNPARVSNQLEFPVLSQDGQQVGDVSDLILDLDNRSVAYVIVTANAGTTVAVPWEFVTLQAGTGAGTGGEATAAPEATTAPETTATGEPTDGTATTEPAATADAGTGTGTGTGMTQENAFVLTVDAEMLNGAPVFDPLNLPEMGQTATADWDADIRSFWEGGGATGPTDGQATAAPETTATGEATADAGAGTDTGTATVEPAATADAGTGTGQAQALQGVALASEVLGSTVTLGTGMGTGGTDTGEATAVPGTDGQATQTPGTDGTANTATAEPAATADAGTSSMTATIEDLIVDTTVGNILYLVVSTTLDAGDERLIPVPLGMFQWDGMGGFILNADGAMLQGAPFFENGQVPDTTMPGWNSEFDSFWQNNSTGGNNNGDGEATATP